MLNVQCQRPAPLSETILVIPTLIPFCSKNSVSLVRLFFNHLSDLTDSLRQGMTDRHQDRIQDYLINLWTQSLTG